MRNKGFSMVELIIVIAIMAILAGALAPLLIKYINNARISTDIDTGAAIGRAITAAVTNDQVFGDAREHASDPQPVNDMDGAEFKKEVFNTFGISEFVGKSKKDIHGVEFDNRYFYYTLDSSRNKVEIFYGGKEADNMIFPDLGDRFKE